MGFVVVTALPHNVSTCPYPLLENSFISSWRGVLFNVSEPIFETSKIPLLNFFKRSFYCQIKSLSEFTQGLDSPSI